MAKGTKQQDLPPELVAWLFSDTDPKTNTTKNEGQTQPPTLLGWHFFIRVVSFPRKTQFVSVFTYIIKTLVCQAICGVELGTQLNTDLGEPRQNTAKY